MNLRFDFIGEINDDNMILLRNCIESQNEPIDNLTINISSLGGMVSSGVTMYNYLKQKKFQIITHNLGEVSSAAILLYLAGTIRTASPISKFMFHPIKAGVNGNLTYYQIEEHLKNINIDINNYKEIVNITTNSLNNTYNIDKFLRSETLTLNRNEALACKIVTVII